MYVVRLKSWFNTRFCRVGKRKEERNDCKDAMSDNSMQNDLHA